MIGLRRARRALAAFAGDLRGVSAIEFALITPVLFVLYFGMSELQNGLRAKSRVSHAASAIGDLTAQTTTVAVSDLNDIFAAATTILEPYDASTLQLRLTSITGDANGKPVVIWSQSNRVDNDPLKPLAKDQVFKDKTWPGSAIATLITKKGDNVIMAEAYYKYMPSFTYVVNKPFEFTETFYLLPRKVPAVPCTDCVTPSSYTGK